MDPDSIIPWLEPRATWSACERSKKRNKIRSSVPEQIKRFIFGAPERTPQQFIQIGKVAKFRYAIEIQDYLQSTGAYQTSNRTNGEKIWQWCSDIWTRCAEHRSKPTRRGSTHLTAQK